MLSVVPRHNYQPNFSTVLNLCAADILPASRVIPVGIFRWPPAARWLFLVSNHNGQAGKIHAFYIRSSVYPMRIRECILLHNFPSCVIAELQSIRQSRSLRIAAERSAHGGTFSIMALRAADSVSLTPLPFWIFASSHGW